MLVLVTNYSKLNAYNCCNRVLWVIMIDVPLEFIWNDMFSIFPCLLKSSVLYCCFLHVPCNYCSPFFLYIWIGREQEKICEMVEETCTHLLAEWDFSGIKPIYRLCFNLLLESAFKSSWNYCSCIIFHVLHDKLKLYLFIHWKNLYQSATDTAKPAFSFWLRI